MQHAAYVERHQLIAVTVSEHSYKSVIAIEQAALGRRDKDAFLRLLKQHAIFFFRLLAFRDVVHHMNGALRLASLLGIRGSRNHRLAAKARIRSFGQPGTAFAVGTSTPSVALRQNLSTEIAEHIRRSL